MSCNLDELPLFIPPAPLLHIESVHEAAASFFFAKYAASHHPASDDYHGWLTQSYNGSHIGSALRAAIEAVGLAGLSNVSYTPQIACLSKKVCNEAVAATKRALDSPTEAIADTTLMAVILLGLYEVELF